MKRAGTATRQLTEFLDLYPTLCDLAGLAPPDHLEGRSFARLLDDPAASHRDAACSEMVRAKRIGRSIRTGDFRYTEWRDRRGRLVARELYDHRDDRENGYLETVNVAGQAGVCRDDGAAERSVWSTRSTPEDAANARQMSFRAQSRSNLADRRECS